MRGCPIFLLILLAFPVRAQTDFTDTLHTSGGDLQVHVLGHASIWFEYNGLSVYVDPYARVHDFAGMAKADFLLVTHADKDHFDTLAIAEILKPETRVIYPQVCAGIHSYAGLDTILSNGDSVCFPELQIYAVPAYNIETTKHPKGVGNGYVIQFGNKRIYISGDTEKIHEMDSLENINLAFLPLSQPYGMTPEMMTETVVLIGPDILVPYHYDDADISPLLDLLKDIPGLEVWTGKDEIPSGYDKSVLDSGLLIRPNPAKDFLFVEYHAPHARVNVFDLAGRLAISWQAVNDASLDVGFLQEGQYILQIITNDCILTGTFLKQ